jgi:hypothetical protein
MFWTPPLWVIREELKLAGIKFACRLEDCGMERGLRIRVALLIIALDMHVPVAGIPPGSATAKEAS